MDTFLRSFVAKVHHHVTTLPAGEHAPALDHMLPAIHSSVPPDVVAKALATLCHLGETPRRSDTLARLLDLMTMAAPHSYSLQAVHDACKLFVEEGNAMCNALGDVEAASAPGAVHSVLDWYFACGSTEMLLQFVHFLSADETLLSNVRRHPSCAVIFSRVGASNPSTDTLACFMLRTLITLVGPSRRCFDYFLRRGGVKLMNVVAAQRIRGADGTDLLDAFLALVDTQSRADLALLPCSSGVADALCVDATDADTCDVVYLLRVPLVRDALNEREAFVESFALRVLESFWSIDEKMRHEALEAVAWMARPSAAFSGVGVELLHIEDPQTLLKRLFIATRGMQTAELLPMFPRILVQLRTFVGKEDDVTQVDEELVQHFHTLVATPSLLFSGLCIDGTEIDQDVLFHTIQLVIGREPLSTHLRCDLAVRDFLTKSILRVHGTQLWGLHVYCDELIGRHDIKTAPHVPRAPNAEEFLSKCPISLDVLHFPVTASDGNTYELEHLLRVYLTKEDAFQSPLTRAALRPYVFFNRALRDADAHLFTLLRSRRRVRNA